MRSHFLDQEIFGEIFSTAELLAIFDERSMYQSWLDAEVALALAEARTQLIPQWAAEQIRAAARVENLDFDAMRGHFRETSHLLMPLLRELVRLSGDAGRYVHWGATTQDILDTGMILQLRRAFPLLRRDLVEVVRCLTQMAARHRSTVMAGRTHGQHALPITFGFKVAIWLEECLRHLTRLDQLRPRLLVGQLGGGVGTLAGFGANAREVQRLFCDALDLGVPPIAWHVSRDALAEFTLVAASVAATVGRVCNEIAVLQRTEVAELEEPFLRGNVGSSTMPHKRNPLLSEMAVAIGNLLRANATTAIVGMSSVHERDGGPWAGEVVRVGESACLLGGALALALHVLTGLRVDEERMAKNLELTGGLICSEAVMLRLGESLGRDVAHDVLYELGQRCFEEQRPFRDLLLASPEVREVLDEAEIERLLEPANYLGAAESFVDTTVARARRVISSGDGSDDRDDTSAVDRASR